MAKKFVNNDRKLLDAVTTAFDHVSTRDKHVQSTGTPFKSGTTTTGIIGGQNIAIINAWNTIYAHLNGLKTHNA